MKSLNKDRVLGIILLLVSAFFAFNTTKLKATNYVGDPGPKMFPFLGVAVCVICAVLLIIKPEKSADGKVYLTKAQFKSAAKLLVVYALIFLLMWLLGYTITVPVILTILCFMFSKVTDENIPFVKNLIRSIIYAVLISLGLYLLYVVALKTQLPKGLIFEMIAKK